MTTNTIGYIGLGVMGLPFARHLKEAGHAVLAYDPDPAAVARARTAGLAIADSAAAIGETCDIVFTCLPSPVAVEAVYAGLAEHPVLCIDNSTVRPELARDLSHRLAEAGGGYVECPMLGGAVQAEAGELFLLVSGIGADVDRALPLVDCAAREVRVVGGPGAASLFKTVQNGLGHVQAVAIAEALALVASAGGDLDEFIEIVGAGGGMASTPLFRAKAPLMRQRDPEAEGSLHIAAKDSRLAADLAAAQGLDLPLFARAASVYDRAMAAGLGKADMSATARIIEKETGVTIAGDDTP